MNVKIDFVWGSSICVTSCPTFFGAARIFSTAFAVTKFLLLTSRRLGER